jgi:osmotically-inducible protein OsmY
MLKAAMRVALGLSLGLQFVSACQNKKEAPPSPRQTAEVGAAQADEAKALADKAKADQAVEKAKAKQDEAETRLDVAKEKAKATASNVADTLKDKNGPGPDKGWAHDWATFAATTQPSADKGDYTVEREKDGSIAAYRKTKPVAGASDTDLKDSALATQVKTRLSQDEDESLHGLDVDAKDHVVHLRGTVKNTDTAGSAVRIALGTPGAEKVISHLTWASN